MEPAKAFAMVFILFPLFASMGIVIAFLYLYAKGKV
jgi:hypothetical protein